MSAIVLPDFLQDETEEQIMSRMIARLPSDLDVSEGSYLWDALAPVAAEVVQMKLEAREILKRAFIQYSYGNYVDARAADRGVTRKSAVKAIGQVQVTGAPATAIPAGTRFSTTADLSTGTPAIEFVSTAQASIGAGGTVLVNIEAVDAGAEGNVPAGAINQLMVPIAGVTAVSNLEATSGGALQESDDDLISRYLEQVQRPPDTGNKNDYIRWVKEVAGVGDAICIPLWNGPGTVKVVIVDSTGAPPNSTLVQQVQDYISPAPGMGEGRAPIGASVTVTAPTTVSINVTATLTYAAGYDPASVRASVEATIDTLLKGLKIGEDVRYAAIANAVYDTPGVADYSNLLVNGGAGNVAVAEDAKAVKGVISLT
ncbi:MAG: baseplate J/gp47 family protein [Firmicutes bacterium]|nr:baseplate J/gp47 family protein [Bacillota bacterium]